MPAIPVICAHGGGRGAALRRRPPPSLARRPPGRARGARARRRDRPAGPGVHRLLDEPDVAREVVVSGWRRGGRGHRRLVPWSVCARPRTSGICWCCPSAVTGRTSGARRGLGGVGSVAVTGGLGGVASPTGTRPSRRTRLLKERLAAPCLGHPAPDRATVAGFFSAAAPWRWASSTCVDRSPTATSGSTSSGRRRVRDSPTRVRSRSEAASGPGHLHCSRCARLPAAGGEAPSSSCAARSRHPDRSLRAAPA